MDLPTLTDFLLERIAEDESLAQGALDWASMYQPKTNRAHAKAIEASGGLGPERVLAECEAKRKIVEQHSEYAHLCPSGINLWTDDGDWIGCRTLAALAAVYADHVHYRDEDWGIQ